MSNLDFRIDYGLTSGTEHGFHRVGWRRLLAVAAFAAAGELLLAYFVGLDRPLRADEPHFVRVIVAFGTSPLNLDLLAHYDAMSGPVPFLLYGAWGRVFGFEPQALRLFSIVVAVVTYTLWYWFLHSESGNGRLPALGTAFVALHPYMLYLSLFIYTDMLAILCLVGALAAVRRERPLLLAAALCGGALNRQYLVFATAAAGGYWLARWIYSRQGREKIHLLAVVASTIPLGALCCLWGGLCPDGALRHVYPDAHATFHPSSLVLYVSLAALYLAPLLWLRRREFFFRRKTIVFAAASAWLYWLFPVTASRSAIEANTRHVGMLHQALDFVTGNDFVAQCVFFAGFAGGLVLIGELVLDAIARWRTARLDFQIFLDLVVLAFLAVMPWSYLHWEKYLMPLVPVLVLRILFVPFRESNRWRSGFSVRALRAGHTIAAVERQERVQQQLQLCE
ncbi:MAG: hypothetical protein HY290_01955 [Planctomycetia bacterium]|nr:hypothetical protein [Planctomycetia bacterium]